MNKMIPLALAASVAFGFAPIQSAMAAEQASMTVAYRSSDCLFIDGCNKWDCLPRPRYEPSKPWLCFPKPCHPIDIDPFNPRPCSWPIYQIEF